jgi:integrase
MSARLEKTRTPGVYRRGSRYVVTFRDRHGVARKRSAGTLAEARDLKASLITDVRRGEYRPQTRIRFKEYAREWAATYQGRTSRGIRPETLLDYKADLERHAIPFFGHLELAEIEPRDLKALAAYLAGKGLAPATVRCILGPVRALFATAYEDGLIRTNPAAGLRLAQPNQHGQQAKRKALSEAELQRFLAALPPEWRLFFEFLAHTGLRIGEAIALTWNDVDLGKRRLHVRRRLYRGRLDTPKSDYGLRIIPLAPALTQALWRMRGTRPGDAVVFSSEAGGYLDPSNTRARVLKPAARKAGLPWIGFHTFRHTCATTLFRHGLNAKQVQAWLGHHSPAFTLSTYIHLLPDDLPDPDFLDSVTQQTQPADPPHPSHPGQHLRRSPQHTRTPRVALPHRPAVEAIPQG